MIALPDLAPARPPCSNAERAGFEALAAALRSLGLRAQQDEVRAATSPTWIPLLRALLRVWAVAFLAAYRPGPAIVLAAAAVLVGVPSVGALIRYLPLVGGTTRNVVARIEGSDPEARPVVVTAHLDTHPTAGAPMGRFRSTVGSFLGFAALGAALAGRPGLGVWRVTTLLVAVEALATIAWLAKRELTVVGAMPDDNTSGLLTLLSVAGIGTRLRPVRDVWLVATGAGTSGAHGLTAFLRSRAEAARGWIIEVDALGDGEVVASPSPARFPHPGTPPSLVRSVVGAARATGDPLNVRSMRRPHSDARAALRMRCAAITLTGGLRPPAGQDAPDAGNIERVAQLIDGVARLEAERPQTPV